MRTGMKLVVFVLILDFMIISTGHVLTGMTGDGSSYSAEYDSSELSSYSDMDESGVSVNENQTAYLDNLGKESEFDKLVGGMDVFGKISQFFGWLESVVRTFAMPVLIWDKVFPTDPTGSLLFVKQFIQGLFTVINVMMVGALIFFVRGRDL